MTDIPPFGVLGCRCTLTGRDGPEDWTKNPHCPYHGALPRGRMETGEYRVITGAEIDSRCPERRADGLCICGGEWVSGTCEDRLPAPYEPSVCEAGLDWHRGLNCYCAPQLKKESGVLATVRRWGRTLRDVLRDSNGAGPG